MKSTHQLRSGIELLECRETPASILSFTDVDGDDVRIAVSKGTLTLGGNVTVVAGQLRSLDLTDASFQGANVSLIAYRDPVNGGDGVVNAGHINAAGRDLGAVLVDGDLGAIDAGDIANPASACKSLRALSLGRFGTSTGAPDLESIFFGKLDNLIVKSDVREASVYVIDSGANGKIGSVWIGGSLIGGAANNSGSIFARDGLGRVTIRGDIIGGAGTMSGAVYSMNTLASAIVGGSILGGSGEESGVIKVDTPPPGAPSGTVTILGNLVGASGYRSGMITGKAAFAGINIGGSIIGGDNHESGAIVVYRKCGPVRIAGNIEGGSDAYTGSVSSLGSIASVTAGGSLIGGSGMGSGHIYSGFVLGPVRIGHDFVGGSVSGSASLYYSGFITGDRIVSVFVGGSIRAGVDDSSDGLFYSPAIQSANDIGPIVVRGNIIGTISTDGDPSDGDFTPVIISARGQGAPTATTNVAIQSLTVGGRVEMAQILGGYDFSLVGVNADAQIGAVMVGGDWIASRIVAGGFNGADGVAGTDDDQFLGGGSSAIESKIVSVTIMGQAIGTIDAGDSFGIMAEKIGALKIAGTSYALTEGNDNLPVGATGDLRVVDWF